MRWLHLSDLHIGHNDETQRVAMKELVSAIGSAASNRDLDLVLMTGDLAFSGVSEEYATFKKVLLDPLRSLPIARNAKILSVPGNHDLDCDCSHPLVWNSLGNARQQVFWNFDERGLDVRANRAAGFAAYADFIKQENILGLDPTSVPASRIVCPSYRSRDITFICLNTALFSDKLFSEQEEKNISPLPTQPLRSLVESNDANNLIVVLGHHPLEWFEPRSRRHFKSAIREIGAIYLHGHEHAIQADFSSHALRALGFGAAYPASLESSSPVPYTSTFAICELNDALHIQFTAWEPTHGSWRPFHALQSDFDQPSSVLPAGYEVPIPTSPASSPIARRQALSERIRDLPKIQAPIWIEGDTIQGWSSLLTLLGLIPHPDKLDRYQELNVGIYTSFLVTDRHGGNHLVQASSAETTIVAYDHVEHLNTSMDTLKLDSCTIVTLGKISEAAENLANSLRQTKNIQIVGGSSIADRLSESDKIIGHLGDPTKYASHATVVPLVVNGGIALLVVDAIKRSWYRILDVDGKMVNEFDELGNMVREKLPELKLSKYEPGPTESSRTSVTQSTPFDHHEYKKRCLTLFDTAKYAGLAAVGVKLPIESLRQIYVPTAANVERDYLAIEATNRAIDELVQTLGLDEHQRAQLTRQMKESYGARQTSEVNAASYLYQSFGNVVVLGDPGSGKSCFVRSEILAYCEPPQGVGADWYSLHIPVFLPLAEFAGGADSDSSLLDHCVSHAQAQGLKLSRLHLDVLLSRGRVALFFDGLDEIGSIATRQNTISDVHHLVDQFAPLGNRFVLTSRPAAIRDVDIPPELTRLTLQGLTDLEIELLATRLFSARYQDAAILPDADREVISSILQDCQSKPGIRRLARNPLLLTLLVFIYENSGPFAARRHLIYSQAVKTLVSVRHRDVRSAMLSEADLRARLGRLAVAMFRRETSALPSRTEVATVMADFPSMTFPATIEFIQEVAENTGLLHVHPRTEEKVDDLVSFMHHSFLEYYTALGFIEEGDAVTAVAPFALLTRWYEIVTLMFGILSEQTDITPGIEALCKPQSASDAITASRIELALDCAMECDVPPEATQELLARELHHVLSEGAGLFVSEVRESLASKVRTLLETTGSRRLMEALLEGICSDDPEIAAAYVHFGSKMGDFANHDKDILDAISRAFHKRDRVVQLSVVNALRDLPSLRTGENLSALEAILDRGGVVEKSAALQVLEEVPSLIPRYVEHVSSILYADRKLLALTAASCILRGGLPPRAEFRGRTLLDTALEILTQNDGPRQSLLGKLTIPWEQLEDWIYSDDVREKQRGFRSLVAIEQDAVKVHQILFRALKEEKDNVVLAAVLDSLSSYPAAIRSASLADTDLVCRHARSDFGNVRTAAVRALRSFPSMQVVTDALIDRLRGQKEQYTKETEEVLKSIAMHAAHDESCRKELADELDRVLRRRGKKWNKRRRNLTTRLLVACDQVGVSFEQDIANMLRDMIGDFRTPMDIRALAIKFFGQACSMDDESAGVIMKEFQSLDSERRLSAYRAADRFLSRCRGRIQTVQFLLESLERMREELIAAWRRESGMLTDRLDATPLREIRACLLEIEATLNSYNEFAERLNASSATIVQ